MFLNEQPSNKSKVKQTNTTKRVSKFRVTEVPTHIAFRVALELQPIGIFVVAIAINFKLFLKIQPKIEYMSMCLCFL